MRKNTRKPQGRTSIPPRRGIRIVRPPEAGGQRNMSRPCFLTVRKRGLHPLSPQSGYLLRTRQRNPTLTHRAPPPCFDKKRKERMDIAHVRKQEEKDRSRETQGGKERRRRRTGRSHEKAGTDRTSACRSESSDRADR